jgi:hypothetical protein
MTIDDGRAFVRQGALPPFRMNGKNFLMRRWVK